MTTQTITKEKIRKYPFIPWQRLKPEIQWKQSQHVLCVGGTGSGKSTLTAQFITRRDYLVVFVSKGRDPIFERPPYKDWPRYTDWPPKKDDHKILLWPANAKDVQETRDRKQMVFRKAMNSILLHEGGWCIDIDELHYLSASLKLEPYVVDLQEQGRSHDISIWGNTQRPAGIPLACYVNASHGFFFLTQEDYDVKRLGSIRNRHTNARELMWNIENLTEHEFVYIDRVAGRLPPVRSIVDIRK